MCVGSKPSTPKVEEVVVPEAVLPAPAPEAAPAAPVVKETNERKQNQDKNASAAQTGTNQLIIPLNIPTGGAAKSNSLSIPR